MSFPTIPVLPVGTTGLKASRLGYGCMGLHMVSALLSKHLQLADKSPCGLM